MPVTRIPVDVVMERVPLVNRWVSEKWQPATVVAVGAPAVDLEVTPGAPAAAARHVRRHAMAVSALRGRAASERGGGLLPEPVRAATARVRHVADVRRRPAAAARPVIVTLSYNEAARMMDGGEQVDSVALPLPLQAMLVPFIEEHYKPEPKKKVRRNDPFAADEGRDARAPVGDADKPRRS